MKPSYVEHKDRAERIRSAITAIRGILPLDIYPAHKRELLSVCIWKITEADGKKKVRYWSEGAILNQGMKLQHEHVYERKELINRLLTNENIEFVVKDAIACMVTVDEHRKLRASTDSGWERYKSVGIRVYDAKVGKWCW